MKSVLEMVFKTGGGKTFRLTLDEPKEGITAAEIQTAMNQLIFINPFNIEGGLTEIQEANIITTETEPVVFA